MANQPSKKTAAKKTAAKSESHAEAQAEKADETQSKTSTAERAPKGLPLDEQEPETPSNDTEQMTKEEAEAKAAEDPLENQDAVTEGNEGGSEVPPAPDTVEGHEPPKVELDKDQEPDKADDEDAALEEQRAGRLSSEPYTTPAVKVSDTDVDGVGSVLRSQDQNVGTQSHSAVNVRKALGLREDDQWDQELHEAIKRYQASIGQAATGFITRDQARRLHLAYV